MISQTAEYALRAVLHLARSPELSQSTREIATITRVPSPYLSKVMQALSRAGMVHPQRGVHGGFSLVRSPEEITIYDVINAVDPNRRIEGCPLGLLAHGVNLCPLHKRLDNAMAMVEAAFRESTLADLLAEPTESQPLCPFKVNVGPSE